MFQEGGRGGGGKKGGGGGGGGGRHPGPGPLDVRHGGAHEPRELHPAFVVHVERGNMTS